MKTAEVKKGRCELRVLMLFVDAPYRQQYSLAEIQALVMGTVKLVKKDYQRIRRAVLILEEESLINKLGVKWALSEEFLDRIQQTRLNRINDKRRIKRKEDR